MAWRWTGRVPVLLLVTAGQVYASKLRRKGLVTRSPPLAAPWSRLSVVECGHPKDKRKKRIMSVSRTIAFTCLFLGAVSVASAQGVVVGHECTNLSKIPEKWIDKARADLHIAYGHTSHGSQLVTGMEGLVAFKGKRYRFGDSGRDGALDFRDRAMRGAADLGNPDRTAWAAATRTYLDANPVINVVLWSWCGQAATSIANIDTYLDLMEGLVRDYPRVRFVFMTGHLTGGGLGGRLHKANEHIREHCRRKNRVLFDFADIESFDPDGNDYGDRLANDRCDYDSDGDGRRDANWAREWQESHKKGVDWFECRSAHSEPLNANQKAYACWWLWARLAGWTGSTESPPPALEDLARFLRAGEEAEAAGDKVGAYVHYRAAVEAAGRMPDLDDSSARTIRTLETKKLRELEKLPEVKDERNAGRSLRRCLTSAVEDLEKIAEDHPDTPSGRRAAALARKLRDRMENRGE